MNDKIKVKEKPKTITVKDKMEKVLNLIPVQSASDTIRSFCLQFDKCSKECPFHNAHGKGCYFNNVTPDKWEIGEMIYKMTEEAGENKDETDNKDT